MAEDLDDVDWALLRLLQDDGRLSVAELARRVSLSPTAVSERVGRLERRGVIVGYRATVDLAALGASVVAIVRLQYVGRAAEPLGQLLRSRHEILECQRVTGEDCYILRVAVGSMEQLAELVDEIGANGTRVITSIVYNEPLPFRGLMWPPEPSRRPQPPARSRVPSGGADRPPGPARLGA